MRGIKYGNDADVIKMLLEKGADVNATDNKKKTALMIARETGRDDEIIKLLTTSKPNGKRKFFLNYLF